MQLAFSPDGGSHWEERSVAGRFDWMQQGCPHTTGGLALTESWLHAVVQTGKENEAGIYYMVSENEGRDWSRRHRLVGAEGHYADLAATSDEVAVLWQEQAAPARSSWVCCRTMREKAGAPLASFQRQTLLQAIRASWQS